MRDPVSGFDGVGGRRAIVDNGSCPSGGLIDGAAAKTDRSSRAGGLDLGEAPAYG
jgi:hypothetical protein